MQSMVPQYLEASMDAFRRNQTQFRQAMEGAFAGSPFAEITRRNMDMLEAAAQAFKPPVGGAAPVVPPVAPQPKDDLAALKEQMAALQAKLDKMGK